MLMRTSIGVAAMLGKTISRRIVDYTEAIRLNPKFGKAYYNRGIAYLEIGKCDKAVADLSEEIRLNPNDAKAYSGLGICSRVRAITTGNCRLHKGHSP